MVQNFYEVLQVDRNATLDEIKQAFKRRALQVHPDKGGTSEGLRKGQGENSEFVETTPAPIAPWSHPGILAAARLVGTVESWNPKKPITQNQIHRSRKLQGLQGTQLREVAPP